LLYESREFFVNVLFLLIWCGLPYCLLDRVD
jgi:hypothetical protein